MSPWVKQNLFVGFARLTWSQFSSQLCSSFSPLSICSLPILQNYSAPIFLIISTLHHPVPLNQICPIFSPSPPQPPSPLRCALLAILGFGEGARWQCWHLFEGLARCQQQSITPATRVTLLDLSPTNLSADAFCGRKTSGHCLFGIHTAKVPTGDLKMGGGKALRGCYNVEEVRQFLERSSLLPTQAGGWSTQRTEGARWVGKERGSNG